MSENSLREITQQIDHLAESYDIHHSNLAGILNHVKNERDALNQMESELTQSRAENALLVENLERAEKVTRMGPFCVVCAMKREQPHKADCPFAALTTLPDQVKELLRIRDAANQFTSKMSEWLGWQEDHPWDTDVHREWVMFAAAMKSNQGREVG